MKESESNKRLAEYLEKEISRLKNAILEAEKNEAYGRIALYENSLRAYEQYLKNIKKRSEGK